MRSLLIGSVGLAAAGPADQAIKTVISTLKQIQSEKQTTEASRIEAYDTFACNCKDDTKAFVDVFEENKRASKHQKNLLDQATARQTEAATKITDLNGKKVEKSNTYRTVKGQYEVKVQECEDHMQTLDNFIKLIDDVMPQLKASNSPALVDLGENLRAQYVAQKKEAMTGDDGCIQERNELETQMNTAVADLKLINENLDLATGDKTKADEEVGAATTAKGDADGNINDIKGKLKKLNKDCGTRADRHAGEVASHAQMKTALAEAVNALTEVLAPANFLQVSKRGDFVEKLASLAHEYKSAQLTTLLLTVNMRGPDASTFRSIRDDIAKMISNIKANIKNDQSTQDWCDKELGTAHKAYVSAQGDAANKNKKLQDQKNTNEANRKALKTARKTKQDYEKNLADAKEEYTKTDNTLRMTQDEYDTLKKGISGAETALKKVDGQRIQQVKQMITEILSKDVKIVEGDITDSKATLKGVSDEIDGLQGDGASVKGSIKTEGDEIDRLLSVLETGKGQEKDDETALSDAVTAEGVAKAAKDNIKNQCKTTEDSYDQRQKRRKQEIEGMKAALKVLEDYEPTAGFLQKATGFLQKH